MFEDIERIEWLDEKDYKTAMYYFQHPVEYEGDHKAFCNKLIEYGERLKRGEALKEHYSDKFAKKKKANLDEKTDCRW